MSVRSVHILLTLTMLMAAAIVTPEARAGTTGKLTGRVVDEKNQPLAGANIRIEGQRLGAVTDAGGNYTIIGVPGGVHRVLINQIGYAPYIAEHVTVTPDFTTSLNATLKTEAVQMGEVRVEAERPLVQKDATSTTRFISGDDLTKQPIRGYRDAAAQQSGVVNFQRQIDTESSNGTTLIVRGGRPNETAYFVDGFSQQDPLTGNSTTSINNNAIEEVVVLNGGFNAEYGRIMSGVVNVITKEGTDKYSGAAEAVTDNLGGNPPGAKSYDYNVYDVNFGGPLIPSSSFGTFYLSGQRRWQGDRSPRSNFDDPLPNNHLAGWTGQAKLSMPIGQNMSLKLGGLSSRDNWREYLNLMRFDIPHMPRYEDINQSATALFSHTLNKNSFYSVGGSWFLTERQRGDGIYFDDLYAYSEFKRPDISSLAPWFFPGHSDPNSPLGRIMDSLATVTGGNGRVLNSYTHRKSSYFAVKSDFTTQLNPYHQIKSGLQLDRHTLRLYQNLDPVNFWDPDSQRIKNDGDINYYGYSIDGRDEVNSGRDGAKHPTTASFYLQDKYERGGLVVNAGVRWDYINTDTPALRNENRPFGTDSQLDPADLLSNKVYSRISPRLGIGFPVSEKTVLHANWGQFLQQPNLRDLYVSYRYLEYKINLSGYYFAFGNPNLKPEQTTAYEFGFVHQLTDVSKVDVTAYYKDVKDLVQVRSIASVPNNYASYRNVDFATIKGVDVSYTLRRVNHVAVNVNYSLSYANGTGSVSDTQRNIAWTSGEPPKQTSPLDFDQRHKIAFNLDYLLGKEEGPTIGGGRPFADFDLNVLYNVASGTPYTPTNVWDEVTLNAVTGQPVSGINSRYAPWTQSLDFKATKRLGLSNLDLSAYLWVINTLDTKNSISVFTGTGSAYTTGYLETSEGRTVAADLARLGVDPQQAYSLALQDENLFSNPRQVRFGLRLGF